MNIKILKAILTISAILIFSACAKKEIVYVDRIIEIKTPVSCKVPEVKCDFKQVTDTEVISSLLICISDLKQSVKVCQ